MASRYSSNRQTKGQFNNTVTGQNVTDPRDKERNSAGFPHSPPQQTGIFRHHFSLGVQKEKDGPAKDSINEHTKATRREVFQILADIAANRQLNTFAVEAFCISAFFYAEGFEDVGRILEATNVRPQQIYSTLATTEADFTTFDVEDAKDRSVSEIFSVFTVLTESMCQVTHRAQGKQAFIQSQGYMNKNKHKFDKPFDDLSDHLVKLFESNTVSFFIQKSAAVEKYGLTILNRIMNTTINPAITPKKDFKPSNLSEVPEMRMKCILALDAYFGDFPFEIDLVFHGALRVVEKKFEDAGDVYVPTFDGELTAGYLFKNELSLKDADNEKAQNLFFGMINEFWIHFSTTRLNNVEKANAFYDGQEKLYSSSGGMTSNAGMTHYPITMDNVLKEAGVYLGAGHAQKAMDQYAAFKKFLGKEDLPNVVATDVFERDLCAHKQIPALSELQESVQVQFSLDTEKWIDVTANLKNLMKDGCFEHFKSSSIHNHMNIYGEEVPECKNVSDDEEEDLEETKQKGSSSDSEQDRKAEKERLFIKFEVPEEIRPFMRLPDLSISEEDFKKEFEQSCKAFELHELGREKRRLEAAEVCKESSRVSQNDRFGFDLGEKKDTLSMNNDEYSKEKNRRKQEFLAKLQSSEFTDEQFEKLKTGMGRQEFIVKVEATIISEKKTVKSDPKESQKKEQVPVEQQPQVSQTEKLKMALKGEELSSQSQKQVEWNKYFDFEAFKKVFPKSNTFLFPHIDLRLYYVFFSSLLELLRDSPEISQEEAHVSMKKFLQKSHPSIFEAVRKLHIQTIHLKDHYPEKVVEAITSFRTQDIQGTTNNKRSCGLIYEAHAHGIFKLLFREMFAEVGSPAESAPMIEFLIHPLNKVMLALEESNILLTRGVLCECMIFSLNSIFDLDYMSDEIKEEEIPDSVVIDFRDLGPYFKKDLFQAKMCQRDFKKIFQFKSHTYNKEIMTLVQIVEKEFKEEYGIVGSSTQFKSSVINTMKKNSLPLSKKNISEGEKAKKKLFSWLTIDLMKEGATHVPYENDRANCAFNCFRALYYIKDSALEMRIKVSEHVIENAEAFKSIYFPEDHSQEEFFGTYYQWIEHMKNPDHFGDTAALEALVVIYEKRLVVRDRYGSRVVLGSNFSGAGVMITDRNIHWEGGLIDEQSVSKSNHELISKQLDDYHAKSLSKEATKDALKTGEEMMLDWTDQKKKTFLEELKRVLVAEIDFCTPKPGDSYKKCLRLYDNTFHPQRKFKDDGSNDLDPEINFLCNYKPFTFTMSVEQLAKDMIKTVYGCTIGRGKLLANYNFVTLPYFGKDLATEMRNLQQAIQSGNFKEGKGETGVDYSPEDPTISSSRANKQKDKASGGEFNFKKSEDDVKRLSNIRRLCFPTSVFFVEKNTYLAIIFQMMLALSSFLSKDSINWDFFDFQAIQWVSRNSFVGLDTNLWNRIGSIFCRTMKKTFLSAEIHLPPNLPRKQLISNFVSTISFVPTEISYLSMGDQDESIFIRICRLSEMACKANIPEVVSHSLHQHLQNGGSAIRFNYRKVDVKRNCWEMIVFGDVSGDEFQSGVKELFAQGMSGS